MKHALADEIATIAHAFTDKCRKDAIQSLAQRVDAALDVAYRQGASHARMAIVNQILIYGMQVSPEGRILTETIRDLIEKKDDGGP